MLALIPVWIVVGLLGLIVVLIGVLRLWIWYLNSCNVWINERGPTVGLLSKASALFGWPVLQLERMRWLFCPSTVVPSTKPYKDPSYAGEPATDSKRDALMHKTHQRTKKHLNTDDDDHENETQNENETETESESESRKTEKEQLLNRYHNPLRKVPAPPQRRSQVLLVAFGGGALQIASVPRYEFIDSTEDLDVDRIFLTDPTQTWYTRGPEGRWDGLQQLRERLAEVARHYPRVIFVGNCLGATGALLLADMAHTVLCFNPQVDPAHHDKWVVRWGARRLPAELRRNLPDMIRTAVARCPQVLIYSGTYPLQRAQTALLQNCPTVQIHWFEDSAANLPGQLRAQDQLFPLLRSLIPSSSSSSSL